MVFLLVVFLVSAVLCGVGLYLLATILPGKFLAAHFNARSNHTVAARQIGGLALIPAIIATLLIFGADAGLTGRFVLCICSATALLWVIGGLDDRFDLSVPTRFGSQIVASCLVVYGLGPDFRLLPDMLPHGLEMALIVLALVTTINVTNFMDGLDLMTVAGIGTPLAGVTVLAALHLAGAQSGLIAAITAGALFGFAFFNRPPASIFLGDSGSFPLGLLAGTAFLLLAKETHIAVALILPLYYIVDAVTTIILRALSGENILKAHSRHAYQIARRSGWSVWKIIGHVTMLNLILIGSAIAMMSLDHMFVRLAFLLVAIVAVLVLILDFRGHFRKL